VISEPLKPSPNAAVLRWLDLQSPATLYVTTISQAELLAGVAALPAGKRRTELRKVIDKELVSLFADRILPFGERSAEAYAQVVTAANGAGNPIDFADAANWCNCGRAQLHTGDLQCRGLPGNIGQTS
jgi:hypothetical protein